MVSGSIPDQRLPGPGETETLDVSAHFTDPDGDVLAYTTGTTDPVVVTSQIARSGALTLAGGPVGGTALVSVTARDPEGLGAATLFTVVVNRRPVGPDQVSAQTLWHGARRVDVDLTGAFSDPDGDSLTYAVTSSDTAIVPVVLHPGPVVSLAGPVQGEAKVTVTARDPDGQEAEAVFSVEVVENPDRAPLVTLYETMGGAEGKWRYSDNWLSDEPIGNWSWVGTNDEGRVSCFGNGGHPNDPCRHYRGDEMPVFSHWSYRWNAFPPEDDWDRENTLLPLGSLDALETLEVHGNSNYFPSEMWAGLSNLQTLSLTNWGNSWGRVGVPPEFGRLSNLRHLHIDITGRGAIPELGDLAKLEYLWLGRPMATWIYGRDDPVPAELGKLTNLRWLYIPASKQGPVPSELGNLAKLEELVIWGDLTGPVPAELGDLAELRLLALAGTHLSGPVPPELRDLGALEELWIGSMCRWNSRAGADEHCAPHEEDFCAKTESMRGWLKGFNERGLDENRWWWNASWRSRFAVPGLCVGSGVAHIVQAAQVRGKQSVPLVAGERAALRLFGMSAPATARFYLDGTEVHTVEIYEVLFYEGDDRGHRESRRDDNMLVPASIVRPGLEFVVESARGRFPASGRQAVDVREVPRLNLTVIPVSGADKADSIDRATLIAYADSMAADPENYRMLRDLTDLMPVGSIRVTPHPLIVIDYDTIDIRRNPNPTLSAVWGARALEGGTGHWMGLDRHLPYGMAYLGGWVSESYPHDVVIAHELGHNFSLGHSHPKSNPFFDPDYPHRLGYIGIWGYARRDHYRFPSIRAGQHLRPSRTDLMGAGAGEWISDYSFSKALEYRLEVEGRPMSSVEDAGPPAPSLLLWGGLNAAGTPYLEPAFVVNAPPALPPAGGEYRLEGRDRNGGRLFLLDFGMPVVADADGAAGFAFTLPVKAGWAGTLTSIDLSGPNGSVTLDEDTQLPMAILRDGRTGQVRAMLGDLPPTVVTHAEAAASLSPRPELRLRFSRGIPGPEAWRR